MEGVGGWVVGPAVHGQLDVCVWLWVRELRNVHLQVFFVGEKSSEYGCHVEQTNATF